MERARGPQAEAGASEDTEEAVEEVGAAMAAVVAGAGGAGPAVLQVAGLYRGLCAVRSRALGLGLVSPAQLRVFPVRSASRQPAGGDGGGGRVGAELEANPFYDRYRDKIQQLRRCGLPRAGGRRAGRRGGDGPTVPGCLTPGVLTAALRGGHHPCPPAEGVSRLREANRYRLSPR